MVRVLMNHSEVHAKSAPKTWSDENLLETNASEDRGMGFRLTVLKQIAHRSVLIERQMSSSWSDRCLRQRKNCIRGQLCSVFGHIRSRNAVAIIITIVICTVASITITTAHSTTIGRVAQIRCICGHPGRAGSG